MAFQKLRLRIDAKHADLTQGHSRRSDAAPDLLQSLRNATCEALSRLESMAPSPTRDFHLAVRELKARQRLLRSVRQDVEAQMR